MYGLVIGQPHLDRILNGWMTYHRRPSSSSKRGRIALVDPADNTIKGFADLRDVVPVTYRDYLDQHNDHSPNADPWAGHRTYYEFRFGNIERARPALPIDRRDLETVWVDIPDYVLSSMRQKSLFDF